MEHSPAPWTLGVDGDEKGWCSEADLYENQRRIVACVNALAGYTTEQLESGRGQAYYIELVDPADLFESK
jgi:hypothetical protein